MKPIIVTFNDDGTKGRAEGESLMKKVNFKDKFGKVFRSMVA